MSDLVITISDQSTIAPTVITVQELTPPSINQLIGVNITNPQHNDGLFFDSGNSVWQNKTIANTNPNLDGGEFF